MARHTHLVKPLSRTRLRKKLLKGTVELLTDIKRQGLKHFFAFVNAVKGLGHIGRKICHIGIKALSTGKRIRIAIGKTGKNHIDINGILERLNIGIEIFFTFFFQNNTTVSIIATAVNNTHRRTDISMNTIMRIILSLKLHPNHLPCDRREYPEGQQ